MPEVRITEPPRWTPLSILFAPFKFVFDLAFGATMGLLYGAAVVAAFVVVGFGFLLLIMRL